MKIDLAKLLYIKAEANYVSFVGENQRVMSLMSMKKASELLGDGFLRAHRSWLVNRSRIEQVETSNVIVAGHKIPIGDNYRDALRAQLPRLG